jgi:hypothetical protein
MATDEFAVVVLEFFYWDVGFALEAGVDYHKAVFDTHHFGGDDFAGAHFRALQRFFEHGGE